MLEIENFKKITIGQLSAFGSFHQTLLNPAMAHMRSAENQQRLAEALHLDMENLELINLVYVGLAINLPSVHPEVNVVIQGFQMNDVQEVRTVFKHVLPDLTIIELMEIGTELRARHERSWAARRFVDMALYMHCTEQTNYDDLSETCIGFPGKPGMPTLVAEAIRVAQENLFEDGHWVGEFLPVGAVPHVYRCVPDSSSEGNVIITTNCGTVYLSGRPKRGDTNSNHLRPV